MKKSIRISPTSLNLLEECSRCFWLKVMKGVDKPSMPPASIIMKIDSILKKYFDKYRELNVLPPIIAGQANGKLPKEMPHTLYYQENETLMVVGKPDDYFELADGSIVPFDHKTRSSPPVSTHSAHQLQMDVYSYLLEKNGYKTTEIAYLAYYYPSDCDVHDGLSMDCKVVEVKTSIERAKTLIKKAIQVIEGEAPEPNKECKYCNWAKGIMNE